ncbi:MAG: hypothetical protein VBE63_08335 [Lamprobacter sp.]|uniref:hypothetical protein n=1 Tax=Lamprobacter sp. TaxID=3100796 RepID=UPI002B25CA45|nr:hypothetical protein [Lamprobacter sp.]MEA3639937.1 hypothetical protein [Lamprobacter sp.]
MNTNEQMWSADLLRRAGLGPRHVAVLMDVHRMTAAKWLTGQHNPHHLLQERANRLMRAVRLSLENHSLPIDRDKGLRPSEIDVRVVAMLSSLMEDDKEGEAFAEDR